MVNIVVAETFFSIAAFDILLLKMKSFTINLDINFKAASNLNNSRASLKYHICSVIKIEPKLQLLTFRVKVILIMFQML